VGRTPGDRAAGKITPPQNADDVAARIAAVSDQALRADFSQVINPTPAELSHLIQTLSRRVDELETHIRQGTRP
jgi:hypothetical protein